MRMFILWVPFIFTASQTSAQTTNLKFLERGYANGQAMQSETFDPTTRDSNGNRLIYNGILQTDSANSNFTLTDQSNASILPGFQAQSGQASITALGNLLSISITGNNNTVILNNRQSNSGKVTAILNEKPATPSGGGQ